MVFINLHRAAHEPDQGPGVVTRMTVEKKFFSQSVRGIKVRVMHGSFIIIVLGM
jgi:hypothetical protein